MAKLPKIYKNTIDKEIHNNKTVYYGTKEEKASSFQTFEEEKNIQKVIDEILNMPTYSFDIPLRIHTKDKIYDTSIVAKSNGTILTFDNDKIPINSIQKIEKKL